MLLILTLLTIVFAGVATAVFADDHTSWTTRQIPYVLGYRILRFLRLVAIGFACIINCFVLLFICFLLLITFTIGWLTKVIGHVLGYIYQKIILVMKVVTLANSKLVGRNCQVELVKEPLESWERVSICSTADISELDLFSNRKTTLHPAPQVRKRKMTRKKKRRAMKKAVMDWVANVAAEKRRVEIEGEHDTYEGMVFKNIDKGDEYDFQAL
jgi:hypothetical protein